MIAFLNVLLVASSTALGTFVAIRAPFLTWGLPILPDAQEVLHWRGLVGGLCTITLQVPLVWLSGLLLGPNLGLLAQALMLLVGLMGLPIFFDGGGPNYVFKPTFGYLLGFLPAAWLSGRLAQSGKFFWALGGIALGQLAMWTLGVTWQVFTTSGGQFWILSIWERSWTGVLQLGPTYFVLMVPTAAIFTFAKRVGRSAAVPKGNG